RDFATSTSEGKTLKATSEFLGVHEFSLLRKQVEVRTPHTKRSEDYRRTAAVNPETVNHLNHTTLGQCSGRTTVVVNLRFPDRHRRRVNIEESARVVDNLLKTNQLFTGGSVHRRTRPAHSVTRSNSRSRRRSNRHRSVCGTPNNTLNGEVRRT